MSADSAVRDVIIAEGAKLPDRLHAAENPYVWSLTVKKLLNKGTIALYLKRGSERPVQIRGPLAIERLDLMVANFYLGEHYPVSIESFSRVLFQNILPQENMAIVLRYEV